MGDGESVPNILFGVEMPDDWSFETAHAKLSNWMESFGGMFTAPTWRRVLVPLIGALLSPGRRTVAAALRVTGLDQDPHFANYHRVLHRSRWSSRRVARCLFRQLVSTFFPSGPVIIGLDDTLERRWGAKITARGIYCDPTRSSHGHFVKASGLRWLSVMLRPEIAWAGRVWALPFLTALAPSERYASSRQRRHKKLTYWGRQVLLQTARWLPGRQIIGVPDRSYAAIDLLKAVRSRVCMITRLRLDACLFDPTARRRPGTVGRPRVIRVTCRAAAWYAKPLPTFSDALALVRRELWTRPGFDISANGPRLVEIPRSTINALIGAACYAA